MPRAGNLLVHDPAAHVTGFAATWATRCNNTLQDILVARWHRCAVRHAVCSPVRNHAGIATQMWVERELAKDGKRRRFHPRRIHR